MAVIHCSASPTSWWNPSCHVSRSVLLQITTWGWWSVWKHWGLKLLASINVHLYQNWRLLSFWLQNVVLVVNSYVCNMHLECTWRRPKLQALNVGEIDNAYAGNPQLVYCRHLLQLLNVAVIVCDYVWELHFPYVWCHGKTLLPLALQSWKILFLFLNLKISTLCPCKFQIIITDLAWQNKLRWYIVPYFLSLQ